MLDGPNLEGEADGMVSSWAQHDGVFTHVGGLHTEHGGPPIITHIGQASSLVDPWIPNNDILGVAAGDEDLSIHGGVLYDNLPSGVEDPISLTRDHQVRGLLVWTRGMSRYSI